MRPRDAGETGAPIRRVGTQWAPLRRDQGHGEAAEAARICRGCGSTHADLRTHSLTQRDRLGSNSSFEDAVKPARRLVGLYRQIDEDGLQFVSDQRLKGLETRANDDYGLFELRRKHAADLHRAGSTLLIDPAAFEAVLAGDL